MRALCLALTLLSSPALGCALPEPFAVSNIADGPVVVVATVTDYRLDQGEGVLTMDVAEVWKGAAPTRLTARWGVMLAEPPPEGWNRPPNVIAALTPRDGGFDLVVEMCGAAWLVTDTPQARRLIRGALLP